MHELSKFYDHKDPQNFLLWNINHKIEMPIRIQREGVLAPPITIIEEF